MVQYIPKCIIVLVTCIAQIHASKFSIEDGYSLLDIVDKKYKLQFVEIQ